MQHNDRFPIDAATQQVNPVGGSARVIASYSTPAVLMRAVEGLYGREPFLDALRTYAQRWAFQHPYPYDLFNTFESTLGEDLDWLWTPTLYETWVLDHAVAGLNATEAGAVVTVEDRGLAPMPAPVEVTYADGRTERQTVPVSVWLGGARSTTLTFPAGSVTRVAIDPEGMLPDVDPRNNVLRVSISGGGPTGEQ
jgi:hypothetical protein